MRDPCAGADPMPERAPLDTCENSSAVPAHVQDCGQRPKFPKHPQALNHKKPSKTPRSSKLPPTGTRPAAPTTDGTNTTGWPSIVPVKGFYPNQALNPKPRAAACVAVIPGELCFGVGMKLWPLHPNRPLKARILQKGKPTLTFWAWNKNSRFGRSKLTQRSTRTNLMSSATQHESLLSALTCKRHARHPSRFL